MEFLDFTANKQLTVINLFGSSGAGKSTVMHDLASLMKRARLNVEVAPEWIKETAVHDGRVNLLTEQDYIFAKQHRRLRKLVGRCDYVITDCPILLGLLYKPAWYPASFTPFVVDVFQSYHNMNFFLERSFEFEPEHRFETAEQSDAKSIELINILDTQLQIPYTRLKSNETTASTIFTIIQGLANDRTPSF